MFLKLYSKDFFFQAPEQNLKNSAIKKDNIF